MHRKPLGLGKKKQKKKFCVANVTITQTLTQKCANTNANFANAK